MKAFGYDHNGAADVFEEYDVPTPDISDQQILIETKAFNLNNFEKSMRAGDYKQTTHRVIPGRDVAGVVAKLGANVTGFNVGDRVVATGTDPTQNTRMRTHPERLKFPPMFHSLKLPGS